MKNIVPVSYPHSLRRSDFEKAFTQVHSDTGAGVVLKQKRQRYLQRRRFVLGRY